MALQEPFFTALAAGDGARPKRACAGRSRRKRGRAEPRHRSAQTQLAAHLFAPCVDALFRELWLVVFVEGQPHELAVHQT